MSAHAIFRDDLVALESAVGSTARRLVQVLQAGHAAEAAGLADRLLTAARLQFALEERRLAASGDPSLERHAHEHARFLSDLREIVRLARDREEARLRALHPERWLPGWLAAHAQLHADA